MSTQERPPTLTPVEGGYIVRMRCGTAARERITIIARDEPHALERYWRLRRMVDGLVRSKRGPEAVVLVKEAASQKTDRAFGAVERAAADLAVMPLDSVPRAPIQTYGEVVRRWLSGEIEKEFPGEVRSKTEGTAEQQWGMYNKYILGARTTSGGAIPFGEHPIGAITKADLIEVKKALPPMSGGRRRYYCMLIAAPMKLAVYPLDIIERHPVPALFVPRKSAPSAAFTYLYPDEEAQLLACPRVPLVQRFLFGLTVRNGLRISEALKLTESDFDLRRGNISLDRNKTKMPRTWKLDPDCVRAVRLWLAWNPPGEDGLLFPGVERAHVAQRFRVFLRWAGVDRRELFGRTDERRPIRVHDLRASFVTLALAAERGAPNCEMWIRDRTGHTTTKMMETYRRWSRFALDNAQGWFSPLDRALPELVEFARSGRSLLADALDPVEVGQEVGQPSPTSIKTPVQRSTRETPMRQITPPGVTKRRGK